MVHAFHDAILLRCVAHSMVSDNICISAKVIELVGTELESIVSTKSFDPSPCLVFNKSLPLLEMVEDFILRFQQINPNLMRKIINEG